jgi:peptide deformylase
MIRKILQIGAPELTKKSREVRADEFGGKELKQLITDLIDTCEADKEHTAGLAAPQIGVNLRVSLIGKTTKHPETHERIVEWVPIINPVITSESEARSTVWEACLSIGVGDKQLWGPVTRAKSVKISYQDVDGNLQTMSGKGFMSHVIQHELDHLDGVLFLTHVPNPEKNLWKSKELDDYIDKHDEYPGVG